MSRNPQNRIIQTELKHYNEFRNSKTEALRWVQMTTDRRIKLIVETSAKEIDKQLLYFITIDILKLEQQYPSSQDIITLPMNPIINRSFNKQHMPWDLIHCRLLFHYDSVMKAMCCHQNLDGLPNIFLRKYTNTMYNILHNKTDNHQQGGGG